MSDDLTKSIEPNTAVLHAVCNDCGTVRDDSYDHKTCTCGGTYHVDSARCLKCGGRHDFKSVGQACSCGGEIVPKMLSCPVCNDKTHIEHLGESCSKCNVLLRMEG